MVNCRWNLTVLFYLLGDDSAVNSPSFYDLEHFLEVYCTKEMGMAQHQGATQV